MTIITKSEFDKLASAATNTIETERQLCELTARIAALPRKGARS